MQRPLPTYYYLSHFHEFLKFVTGPCNALLDSNDKQFIDDFMALSKPRQCLIVRFINRKSIFVKTKSYTYEEIEDIPDNLDFLFQQDWFRPLQSENIVAFINHLSKREMIQIIDELNASNCAETPALVYKKSHAKATLVACILDSTKVNDVHKTNLARSYWQENFEQHISYFLYLYFGNFRSKLNQFSMRDLGVMRTRTEQAQVLARFTDIASAKSAFVMHSLLNDIRSQLPLLTHSLVLNQLQALPSPIGSKAIELDTQVQFLLACELLKQDATDAIRVLKTINTDIAQEKWAREAYKLGLKD